MRILKNTVASRHKLGCEADHNKTCLKWDTWNSKLDKNLSVETRLEMQVSHVVNSKKFGSNSEQNPEYPARNKFQLTIINTALGYSHIRNFIISKVWLEKSWQWFAFPSWSEADKILSDTSSKRESSSWWNVIETSRMTPILIAPPFPSLALTVSRNLDGRIHGACVTEDASNIVELLEWAHP